MPVKISNQQMSNLKDNLLDDYINELMELFKPHFGQWQQSMGEDTFYQAIEQGITDAKKHSLTQRGPVKYYVNLQLLLGSGFASDLQYPWITEHLTQQHLGQLELTDTIHHTLTPYLDNILGEQNNCLINHLNKLQKLTLNTLGVVQKSYKTDLHALLYELYPQKYQQLGKETIEQLIIKGTEKAYYQYHFEQASHSALFVTTLFSVGYHFDSDPFLPWFNQAYEQNQRITPMETDIETTEQPIELAFQQNNSQQTAKQLEANLKAYANMAMMNYQSAKASATR